MKTTEKVLEQLYKEKGFVSGEGLAASLGISRNSVWKAVNSLKAQGYDIRTSNEGYLLNGEKFDEYAISHRLKREHKLYIYKKEARLTQWQRLCAKRVRRRALLLLWKAKARAEAGLAGAFCQAVKTDFI